MTLINVHNRDCVRDHQVRLTTQYRKHFFNAFETNLFVNTIKKNRVTIVSYERGETKKWKKNGEEKKTARRSSSIYIFLYFFFFSFLQNTLPFVLSFGRRTFVNCSTRLVTHKPARTEKESLLVKQGATDRNRNRGYEHIMHIYTNK